MGPERTDRREADRILDAALADPGEVSGRELDRALELLDSDAERVRIGAAWTLGAVAAESPGRVLPLVPRIAALLDDERTRAEAARALAYIGRSNPEAIERHLEDLDEAVARRCRQAIWGQFAPRTVVDVPGESPGGGAAMGRGEGDEWGWLGGGGRVYDAESDHRRRRPPTDPPVDPPPVSYSYDRYTPVEPLSRGERVDAFKVAYRSPDGRTHPGLFKRFDPPDPEAFASALDRRVGMWQSVDDHGAILPVVDWGTAPDPWLVTAYEDVTGVADLSRRDAPDAAVWTLSRVADALCFAHRRGIVHGGLTPGSVVRSSVISEPDAWRHPRVTDWGYVDLLGPDAVPAPTAEYLAPEHRDPDSFGGIDGATDVYGFGVLAHEALFGRPPERPFDPTADHLPADLGTFLGRCLAERKPERFETVEAMRAAFERASGGDDG